MATRFGITSMQVFEMANPPLLILKGSVCQPRSLESAFNSCEERQAYHQRNRPHHLRARKLQHVNARESDRLLRSRAIF